jgi:hypothetical protein
MALTAAVQAEIAADLAALREKHQDDHDVVNVPPDMPMGVRGLIAGYVVLPHVQRFADAVRKATAVKSIGTYPGHSPSLDRALDLFHRVGDDALADDICDYFLANVARFGGRYVISRRQIWHRQDPVWRWMEDRGDNTQNHYDHVHISFETTAADVEPEPEPEPVPEPTPSPEEDDGMKIIAVDSDRGIFLVGALGEDGRGLARHIGSPAEVTSLVESGAVAGYDKRPAMPADVFDKYYRVVG